MLWFFAVLAIILIVGNAMILLHTAKKPKIPHQVKSKPYQEDDTEW